MSGLFLADFSLMSNPGKTILAGTALVGAGGVASSYLNKKDKRTLRQRVTDVGKTVTPIGLIGAAAVSNKTSQLQDIIRKKYGNKALAATTAGLIGATVAGHVGAQQLRRKHGDETQKRKKGQRLKPVKVNMLGLKYNDYASNYTH